MEKRKAMDLQNHHPEKRLQVASVRQAYEDLFLRPQRAEHRHDEINSMDWLTNESNKKAKEEGFHLDDINR